MRIISGLYKGQSLVSFNADHIRPTTDRVKETLFNLLQLYLDESSIVADCFSGTGNLGIEALSRGAQHVSFIDNSTKSLQILKKNLHKIGVPSEHYRILSLDILSFFKKNDLSAFSIFLIDPPFTKKMADETMLTLSLNKTLNPGVIVAIESLSQEKIQDQYNDLVLLKRKIFKDKTLSLFEKVSPFF
jgi:16S rRNA (guanine966-N2)-methyltransferase